MVLDLSEPGLGLQPRLNLSGPVPDYPATVSLGWHSVSSVISRLSRPSADWLPHWRTSTHWAGGRRQCFPSSFYRGSYSGRTSCTCFSRGGSRRVIGLQVASSGSAWDHQLLFVLTAVEDLLTSPFLTQPGISQPALIVVERQGKKQSCLTARALGLTRFSYGLVKTGMTLDT